MPDQREKEELLRETWSTARHFLQDANTGDENALEYAALVVANGIILTHPFADGNGRTSRVLSYVIATGDTSEVKLNELLEDGQRLWKTALPNVLTHAFDPPELENEGEDPTLDKQSVAYAQQRHVNWRSESANHIYNYLSGLKRGELGSLRWAVPERMAIPDDATEQTKRYKQVMVDEVAKRAVGSQITPIDEAVIVHRTASRLYRDE